MEHLSLIEEAFSGNVQLATQVSNAMRDNPAQALLYVEIAKHIRLLQSNAGAQGCEATETSPKKRKLRNGTVSNGEISLPHHHMKVILEAKDLSFSIPLRKKLHLEIVQDVAPTTGHFTPIYEVRMRNPASGELEHKVGMQSFKHALRLPIPDKAQKQSNFVLLPESGLGIGERPPASESEPQEPLVWAVGEGSQKVITFPEDDLGKLGEARQLRDEGLIEKTIRRCLGNTSAGRLVHPDEAEFVSATPEAHRKGEKAYHVKAFRGSKDGYLFFLATGIFFGFKKPLAFFPFEAIHSVSYTSVLQRTFNLNIAVQMRDQNAIKEHEFAMLDQADFAGIDAYIKRHGLQDASLAESRKAKKLNLNGSKKDADGSDNGVTDQQTELHKAQQSIEDAEDEEEEDYDPGSDGLSDGSGESGEEEEGEEGEARDAGELGSEAEEDVPDPEDDDQL